MRRRTATLGSLLAVGLLAALGATVALGYAGQVAATLELSSPSGPQACGTPITITARVVDTSDDPIEGQPVSWAFIDGNVSGDSILDTETTTNASGVATTQAQFACSARSVTIQAIADDATGTVVVALSGEGLPRTNTAPGSSMPAIALAALAVLLGSGTILRRFASDRR
jgi:hypothetical protein